MQDQVLYKNELLLASAPGDRPAYVMIGTPISNANLHYDINTCPK